jgi:enoyl-[acyl-carrier protein] reductase II
MLSQKVCELLKIKYPIIQGGMALISNANLVSAVSSAGALGLIGASAMDVETLRKNIKETKEKTKNSFGINFPLMRPDVEDLIKVSINENVKIAFTSAGNPAKYTPFLKKENFTVVHVVSSVKQAKKAEDSGCDAVVCEGFEAGGHDGQDELTTLCLVRYVKEAVKIPVIAAGGVVDARTSLACFVLGADAVQIGTRFLLTKECSIQPIFKKLILEAKDNSTIFLSRKFHPVRVLKTDFALSLYKRELEGISEDELKKLVTPMRQYQAVVSGDTKEGLFNCGMGAGLIKEEKTVKEVIEEIISGMEEVKKEILEG